MTRLQKKCFIGATGMHLLLVVILFVGPAFFVADKIDDSDVITFVPAMLTDEKFSNPGATAPRPAPQQQPQPQLPQPQPQQIVEPPKPQPQPQPERDPDPPKIETPKNDKPDPDSVEPKPEKKKPQVKVSNTVVKLKQQPKTTATSKDTTQADANKERQQQIAGTLKNIRGNLSPTTRVEVPEGPGGGTGSGVSYANYAQEVRRVYTEACRIPPDVEDESAVVKVRVTIARSGNVVSSSIVTPSSSAQLNRVIQATLDRVNFVAPFPQGAKDSQRTFIISFDLKAKQLLG